MNYFPTQVKHARERSNRPCDMCTNYETQLQNVQEANKKQSAQLRTMERQLESERKAITQQVPPYIRIQKRKQKQNVHKVEHLYTFG